MCKGAVTGFHHARRILTTLQMVRVTTAKQKATRKKSKAEKLSGLDKASRKAEKAADADRVARRLEKKKQKVVEARRSRKAIARKAKA